MIQMFFGYDHQPAVSRATIYDAARSLRAAGQYAAVSWEDLRVDGQLIIGRITDAIDDSEVALFDVTTLNPNVLFELGYAIARKRRVGILLEKGSATAEASYKRYGLLRGVGYFPWTDTSSIIGKVQSGAFDAEVPLGDALIETAAPFVESSLLFLPALHQGESDSRIRKLVQRVADQRVDVVTADPAETRLESLTWYASKAYSSAATLLHFESTRKTNHEIHNARLALIGGLVHGFGRPLLMVAEDSYTVPLDYEALLRSYSTPSEAEAIVSEWLQGLKLSPRASPPRRQLELAVELKSLNFGEHVAENEIQQLPAYFVTTAEYRAVISSHLSVFIGRKGTGKSANLYLAAAELQSEADHLVVVVRPAAYDFEGLVGLLTKYTDYIKSHAIDGIWKLLLMSEVARVVKDDLESRSPYMPLTKEQQEFLDGVSSGPVDIAADFGSRVDRALASLDALHLGESTPEEGRDRLNEALHSEWIGRLRRLLSPLISSYSRIAILIDNLDKGWERSANLDALSDLLLGLLSAVGRVERELTRDLGRDPDLAVTLALFLRSDIFGYVKERAREPDKIVTSTVEWRDPEILCRVVEERFLATRREGTPPSELWQRFFCPTVNGVDTRTYLLSRVLPRPRDLIYFCNAAVAFAINRRHSRVEEDDILSAEQSYSQFAFEALLVENGITVEEFEAVLLEFLGVDPVLEKDEVFRLIEHAGIDGMKAEQVFERLKAVSFLGVETRLGVFEYPEIGRPTEKAEILARKNAQSDGATRHSVHPAYRSFLEIAD